MGHYKELAILTTLLFLLTVKNNYQEVAPQHEPDSIGRTLSSIFSPFEAIIQGPGHQRRLASIPQRIGINTSEHIFTDEVVVAIVDTGINLNNPWLMERVHRVNGIPQIYDLSGVTQDGSDTQGHGTWMASIILSINPNAKIVPIKYTGSQNGQEVAFVIGLRLARLVPGVSIINISGGGKDHSKAEEYEINKAIGANILVVAASGNHSQNLNKDSFYPASLNSGDTGMITVANLKDDGTLSPNTNYGENVIDLGMLGTDLPGYDHKGNVTFGSGSSQATAMVSGLASLMKGIRPDLDPKDLKDILIKTSSIFPKLKHGRVNASKALSMSRVYGDKQLRNLESNVVSINTSMELK